MNRDWATVIIIAVLIVGGIAWNLRDALGCTLRVLGAA
jgi:hypothetical protein